MIGDIRRLKWERWQLLSRVCLVWKIQNTNMSKRNYNSSWKPDPGISPRCLISSHRVLMRRRETGEPDCLRHCEKISHDSELYRSCLPDYRPCVSLRPDKSTHTSSAHTLTHRPYAQTHLFIKHTLADLIHNLKHSGNLCTQALHRIILMTTCCAVRLAPSMWWSSSNVFAHIRFFRVPGPQRSQEEAKKCAICNDIDLVVVINGLPFWWLAKRKRDCWIEVFWEFM